MLSKKFDKFKRIFSRFIDAEIVCIERLTNGNVNDTYKISAEVPDSMNDASSAETEVSGTADISFYKTHTYILQKMNGYAYSSSVRVMENASMIGEQLKKEGFTLKTPNYYEDKSGGKVTYISAEDLEVSEKAESPDVFEKTVIRDNPENAKIWDDAENAKIQDNAENAKIRDDAENAKIRDDAENAKIQDDTEIAENVDSSLGYWRLCDFIDSTTYNKTTDIAIVKATGTVFGYFEYALRDFDASKLNIVIPDFHDTVKRYDRLMEAYERWQDTIPEIQNLISYLTSVRAYACWLTDLQRAGKLPLRVVHNDTKINNVLFERTPYTGNESRRNNSSTLQSFEEADGDVVPVSPYVDTTDRDSRHPNQDIKVLNRDTRHHPRPIAIIDLDTCMPGLVAHDFGDGIRYAAGIESDGHMTFNMDNFKAFCEGFIPEVAGYLTQEEKDTLYLAPFSMTIELAVRYLTDFFEGNKYFHIDYPLQNLDKAGKQIELARQMYEKEENIREFVSEVLNKATCYVTK